MTYTQTGTTGTLYEDGVERRAQHLGDHQPGQIGNGTTTVNVLGESNYAADNTLRGKVKNFRIYNRALNDAEVATIALSDPERLQADFTGLDAGRPVRRHRRPGAARQGVRTARRSPGRPTTPP